MSVSPVKKLVNNENVTPNLLSSSSVVDLVDFVGKEAFQHLPTLQKYQTLERLFELAKTKDPDLNQKIKQAKACALDALDADVLQEALHKQNYALALKCLNQGIFLERSAFNTACYMLLESPCTKEALAFVWEAQKKHFVLDDALWQRCQEAGVSLRKPVILSHEALLTFLKGANHLSKPSAFFSYLLDTKAFQLPSFKRPFFEKLLESCSEIDSEATLLSELVGLQDDRKDLIAIALQQGGGVYELSILHALGYAIDATQAHKSALNQAIQTKNQAVVSWLLDQKVEVARVDLELSLHSSVDIVRLFLKKEFDFYEMNQALQPGPVRKYLMTTQESADEIFEKMTLLFQDSPDNFFYRNDELNYPSSLDSLVTSHESVLYKLLENNDFFHQFMNYDKSFIVEIFLNPKAPLKLKQQHFSKISEEFQDEVNRIAAMAAFFDPQGWGKAVAERLPSLKGLVTEKTFESMAFIFKVPLTIFERDWSHLQQAVHLHLVRQAKPTTDYKDLLKFFDQYVFDYELEKLNDDLLDELLRLAGQYLQEEDFDAFEQMVGELIDPQTDEEGYYFPIYLNLLKHSYNKLEGATEDAVRHFFGYILDGGEYIDAFAALYQEELGQRYIEGGLGHIEKTLPFKWEAFDALNIKKSIVTDAVENIQANFPVSSYEKVAWTGYLSWIVKALGEKATPVVRYALKTLFATEDVVSTLHNLYSLFYLKEIKREALEKLDINTLGLPQDTTCTLLANLTTEEEKSLYRIVVKALDHADPLQKEYVEKELEALQHDKDPTPRLKELCYFLCHPLLWSHFFQYQEVVWKTLQGILPSPRMAERLLYPFLDDRLDFGDESIQLKLSKKELRNRLENLFHYAEGEEKDAEQTIASPQAFYPKLKNLWGCLVEAMEDPNLDKAQKTSALVDLARGGPWILGEMAINCGSRWYNEAKAHYDLLCGGDCQTFDLKDHLLDFLRKKRVSLIEKIAIELDPKVDTQTHTKEMLLHTFQEEFGLQSEELVSESVYSVTFDTEAVRTTFKEQYQAHISDFVVEFLNKEHPPEIKQAIWDLFDGLAKERADVSEDEVDRFVKNPVDSLLKEGIWFPMEKRGTWKNENELRTMIKELLVIDKKGAFKEQLFESSEGSGYDKKAAQLVELKFGLSKVKKVIL